MWQFFVRIAKELFFERCKLSVFFCPTCRNKFNTWHQAMLGREPECWGRPKTWPGRKSPIGVVYPFHKNKGGFAMSNRAKQRENRRKKHQKEVFLEMRNMYGHKDLTPYNAVLQIRTGGKATIRLNWPFVENHRNTTAVFLITIF